MNQIARDLNKVISGTVIDSLLSDFGKRMYFPKGIAAQAAEAGKHAWKHNPTVGMAKKKNAPMVPDVMAGLFSPLSSNDAVSYAPNGGDAELRKAWLSEILRKNPDLTSSTISTPMVVAGLTNGISHAADLFCNPGDTVILPDLFWGNYTLIFKERHCAEMATYPFFNGQSGFNVAGLSRCLAAAADSGGKALVILNFPNNPTGYSPSRNEAVEILEAMQKAADSGLKILAVCDDAYFGLFFEEETYPHSLFSLLHNGHKNILALKVDGPTKEDYSWGFRIGFMTFGAKGLESAQYQALEKKLLGAIRSSISSCSRPAQSMLIQALADPAYQDQKKELFALLKKRYLLVKRLSSSVPTDSPLKTLPYNSGYFLCFEIPEKAEELRQELLHELGVGTIAIGSNYLRVAYAAVDEEDMEELFQILVDTAGKLS